MKGSVESPLLKTSSQLLCLQFGLETVDFFKTQGIHFMGYLFRLIFPVNQANYFLNSYFFLEPGQTQSTEVTILQIYLLSLIQKICFPSSVML